MSMSKEEKGRFILEASTSVYGEVPKMLADELCAALEAKKVPPITAASVVSWLRANTNEFGAAERIEARANPVALRPTGDPKDFERQSKTHTEIMAAYAVPSPTPTEAVRFLRLVQFEGTATERAVANTALSLLAAPSPAPIEPAQAEPSDEEIKILWRSKYRSVTIRDTTQAIEFARDLFTLRPALSKGEEDRWPTYIAGIIEAYLSGGGMASLGREKAIAGIIARRMWSRPAPVAEPAQAEPSDEHKPVMLSLFEGGEKTWPHYFDLKVGQRVRTHTGMEGTIAAIHGNKTKKYHVLRDPKYGGMYGAWEVTPIDPAPVAEPAKCETCSGTGIVGRAPDDYYNCPTCTPAEPVLQDTKDNFNDASRKTKEETGDRPATAVPSTNTKVAGVGQGTPTNALPGYEAGWHAGFDAACVTQGTKAPTDGAVAGHIIDPITDFTEGQWWVAELDAMHATATADQKRAIAVVHHLLASVALAARSGEGLNNLYWKDKVIPVTGHVYENCRFDGCTFEPGIANLINCQINAAAPSTGSEKP